MLVVGVALVVGMHDDVLVAELRLRPSGTNLERAVLEGVELALFLRAYSTSSSEILVCKIRVPVDDAVHLCKSGRHCTSW